MPREYQIKEAFISSIKREPSGRSTVTTADFVEELERALTGTLRSSKPMTGSGVTQPPSATPQRRRARI